LKKDAQLRLTCTESRDRTRNLRFWRPPLYQLSYFRVSNLNPPQIYELFLNLANKFWINV
jgi:hypothetical protein